MMNIKAKRDIAHGVLYCTQLRLLLLVLLLNGSDVFAVGD